MAIGTSRSQVKKPTETTVLLPQAHLKLTRKPDYCYPPQLTTSRKPAASPSAQTMGLATPTAITAKAQKQTSGVQPRAGRTAQSVSVGPPDV